MAECCTPLSITASRGESAALSMMMQIQLAYSVLGRSAGQSLMFGIHPDPNGGIWPKVECVL